MGNEEKILRMLEELQTGQAEMRADMVGMKADMVDMKTDMVDMKADMVGVKTDIVDMKADMVGMRSDIRVLNQNVAKIEVEHGQKLGALYDGYQDMNRKLDALQTTVDHMAPTVTALDVLHQTRQNKT